MEGPVEKLELIIAKLQDGVIILDKDGIVVIMNPQAEEFLEISGHNILGSQFSDSAMFSRLRMVTSGFDFKKNWGIFKKEIFNNIGRDTTLEVDTIPLKEGSDDFGKLLMIKDTTRERNIERTRDEFIALAAHQLRTPLSAIKWTLAILLDGRAGKISDEQKDIIEKSYQSNERMINLIKDLLNVAKFEEGKYLFNMSQENLQEIVHDVIYELQGEIDRRKINFSFKKPTELLPRIKIDKEKIRLVIENLIGNALKYTSQGGNVTISLKNNRIDIEFRIEDSGIGIPGEQKGKIFSKFFRASNALKVDTDGSGLGLYLSKNIIEAHRGKMGFSSEENKGSVFWFTLPVKEEFEEVLERF